MNCLVKRFRRKIFVLCLWLTALPGMMVHAQQAQQLPDVKVSVSLSNENLAALFKKLEPVSGYVFTYDKAVAEKHTVASASWKDSPLKTVLKYVSDKYGASYIVEGKSIAVRFPVGKGRVTGKIVDEASGDALVNVTVSAGTASAITDGTGNYSLSINPGNYTVQVTNVGYQKKQISDVQVRANEATFLDVTMAVSSGRLEEVVVSSSIKRESVNALYVKQKNAPAISDGISAEQISRTPDKSVGETLKRISGVASLDNRYVVVRGLGERYNQSMLNGQIMPSTELNRKQFSFDIIPANLVDNIVVYKTITADQSAEFGGGAIEVNTKTIPTQNFLSITAGGSYNDQTTGKPFRTLQLEGREYWGLASSHRNLMGKLNWSGTDEIRENFEKLKNPVSALNNNWGVYNMNAPFSQNYQFSLGRVFPIGDNRKIGIIASATYRNTFQRDIIYMTRDGFEAGTIDSAHKASFKGDGYNFTTNLGGILGVGYSDKKSKLSFQTIYLRNLDQRLIFGIGLHNDQNGPQLGFYDLTTQSQLMQNQLKGEHNLGTKGIKFNWSASYMLLDRHKPDNHQLKAELLQKDINNISDEFNINTPYSSGIAEGVLRWWSRANEKNWFWETGLSIPFKLKLGNFAINNTVKTGYTGWSKNRMFYVANTGSKMFEAYYYPPLANLFDSSRGGNVYISQFSDDFHRTAVLHAPYLMLDQKFGNKWRLVYGLRAEYFDQNKVNAALDSVFSEINVSRGSTDQFDFSLLKQREKNLNIFPSANLTYSLTKSMNIRLAFAKSIIRPDLRELSFFKEYDFELGGLYNAGLVRSTKITHYDFRYEWYPGPGEVLSFSIFYKHMDYPMEIFQQDNRLFAMRNLKEAVNKGIEVEMRKSLAFTKMPVIKNLTVYGNVTLLRGSITPMVFNYNLTDPVEKLKVVPEETILPKQDRLQTGASEFMMNAGLFYDIKPLSLSVNYNQVSDRMIRPADGTNTVFSLNERPMKSLDAQIAARFMEQNLEVKCNVSNLLNSSSRQIAENVGYQAIPGRTVSVSATYRF